MFSRLISSMKMQKQTESTLPSSSNGAVVAISWPATSARSDRMSSRVSGVEKSYFVARSGRSTSSTNRCTASR